MRPPGTPRPPGLAPLGRQTFAYPVTTFPAFTYQMVRHIRHIRHNSCDLVSEAEIWSPGKQRSRPAVAAAPGTPGPGPRRTTYQTRASRRLAQLTNAPRRAGWRTPPGPPPPAGTGPAGLLAAGRRPARRRATSQ